LIMLKASISGNAEQSKSVHVNLRLS